METTVKERLVKFIKYLNLSQKGFERHVGLSNGYINNISRSIGAEKLQKILSMYPELNSEWVVTGNGEMLNSSQPCTAVPVEGYQVKEIVAPEEYIRAPIVPATVAKEPGLDAFEYVQENLGEVELSNVVVKDMTISVWHKVSDMSMSPRYLEGDYVGLLMCAKPCRVIPGNTYGIDTISNGMIVRKLYPVDGGFRAHALNSEEYPDFIIKCEDIIRIYRKMIQVRL